MKWNITTQTDGLKQQQPVTLESLLGALDTLMPATLERAHLLAALAKTSMVQPILIKDPHSYIEDVGDLVSEVIISKYVRRDAFYILDRDEWLFWRIGERDWEKTFLARFKWDLEFINSRIIASSDDGSVSRG